MKPVYFVALALTAASAMAQPSPMMPPPRPVPAGTKAFRDIAYVTNGHPRQRLDLYLPASATRPPLIILIHGGAFMVGSKEGENAAEWLQDGYAVASLNYRLSGDAIFPAAVQDCKAAVRWLRANAARYGYDPNRFGAFGLSAGGNLVAMLGTSAGEASFDVGENLKVSSAVQAVADWYGPTDFLQMDAHRVPGGDRHDPADSPESRYVGGPIQENREKVAKANPITYVSKSAPPFFIAHGDQDRLVPHHQSVLLAEALRRAGVTVTFYTVKGGGHGFNDAVATSMTHAFFAKHLKGAPAVGKPAGP